ncbi:hypothetical protein L7F22_045843 [Adiantum nelumboides]|nr:hypothetical protein [Adiantum nelumboides]
MAAASSSSYTKYYQIEKLNGPNYLPWSLRLQMLLEKAGNLGVVVGTKPNPATAAVSAGQAAPTQADIDAWKKKDLEARTEIVLHLGDKQLQLVRQSTTAREMWDILKQQYQRTNVVSRVLLHKQLNELTMRSFKSTDAFLDAWQKASDDVLIAGLKLSEEIQVTTLLAALPDEWQSFITTHSNNPVLTVAELVALIRQEDQLRARSNSAATYPLQTSMAMAVGGSRFSNRFRQRPAGVSAGRSMNRPLPCMGNARTFSSSSRNVRMNPNYRGNNFNFSYNPALLCTFCRRRGHEEYECRTKQRSRGNYTRSRNQANITELNDSNIHDDISTLRLFMAVGHTLPNDHTWYLDTGATHNVTGDSSWLHDYKPIQLSMEVRLGDDGAYMAEGMGTVYLKLPTGDVTKITGVYYIPGLAKNLLSVSEVTKSGTSIEFFHKYCTIKASIPNQTPVRLICPQKDRLYPLGISACPLLCIPIQLSPKLMLT